MSLLFLLWHYPLVNGGLWKKENRKWSSSRICGSLSCLITLLDFSSFLSPIFQFNTVRKAQSERDLATFNCFLSLHFFSSLEWSQIVEIKVLNRQQSLLTNSRPTLTYTILITFEVFANYMVNLCRVKGGGRIGVEPERLSLLETETPIMEKHNICQRMEIW